MSLSIVSSRFMRYAEELISAYIAATDTTSFERGLKYSSFFFEKVGILLPGSCLERGMSG